MNPIDTLVTDAGTLFSTTTGFTIAQFVTYVGNIAKQILGGGLGLVNGLLGWIVAFVIIGVVLHLLYRAMRFLHIFR